MRTQKGYIGERFDPETGLQYLNARYYDPKFGRFIPPDDTVGDRERAGVNHCDIGQSNPSEARQ
ncbi:hypothetical protein IB270_33750 [Ensifer sp. ENS05]|nr:hypothetical protein [Ensifer sp. ENS05]